MSHIRLINISMRFIHLFFLLGVHVNKRGLYFSSFDGKIEKDLAFMLIIFIM